MRNPMPGTVLSQSQHHRVWHAPESWFHPWRSRSSKCSPQWRPHICRADPRSLATLYNPARTTASAIVKDDSWALVGNLERREFTPNRTKLPLRTISANCCYRVAGRHSSDSIPVNFPLPHNNALRRMSMEVVWLWWFGDVDPPGCLENGDGVGAKVKSWNISFFMLLFERIKFGLTWEDKTPLQVKMQNCFGGPRQQKHGLAQKCSKTLLWVGVPWFMPQSQSIVLLFLYEEMDNNNNGASLVVTTN